MIYTYEIQVNSYKFTRGFGGIPQYNRKCNYVLRLHILPP